MLGFCHLQEVVEELKKKMKKTDQEGGKFLNLTFTLLGATKEEFLLTISEHLL